ncbi:unnamed protein product [Euphydryas editha]|uniref:Uncharacterized protein n=1 Tax=Euphydryas editha TaxID=104508 RepID=A0AAU9TP28_EUPED|nr:unnamed protein product [Euphydryas editha]
MSNSFDMFNPTGNGRNRYDTFAGYGNLFPPQNVQRGPPRPPRRGRGQTRARQIFQSQRMETKRRTEGAKTLDKIQDLVKTTLNPGVKTCDELAARIGETYTLKAITLSITTRAIGFGLAHLSFIAVSYHEIAVPSIYAQYRVFLGDFIDFKNLLPGGNWTTNTDNQRVLWSQFKQEQILPESPKISYKTDFCEQEFKSIIINNPPKTRAKNRTRLEYDGQLPSLLTIKLTKAYTGKLPIPREKLKDLTDLCKSNVIPSIYHDFYMNLIGTDEDFEHQTEDEAE